MDKKTVNVIKNGIRQWRKDTAKTGNKYFDGGYKAGLNAALLLINQINGNPQKTLKKG